MGYLNTIGKETNISLGFAYADNASAKWFHRHTRSKPELSKAVNTIPDVTWNRSPSFTLDLSHSVSNP